MIAWCLLSGQVKSYQKIRGMHQIANEQDFQSCVLCMDFKGAAEDIPSSIATLHTSMLFWIRPKENFGL